MASGLSPDEAIVYCNDTDTQKLWAFDIAVAGQADVRPTGLARGRVVCTLPGHQWLDSLAVEANGNVCSATLINGGITVFAPDGSVRARRDARSDDDEHLFRRRRYARRLHHAVRHGQAGEGALAAAGPEAEFRCSVGATLTADAIGLCVPLLQLPHDRRQRQISALQQQREMKQQVGGLADQPLVRLRHRRERNFDAFLADFLRDARRAFRPQSRAV